MSTLLRIDPPCLRLGIHRVRKLEEIVARAMLRRRLQVRAGNVRRPHPFAQPRARQQISISILD
ncbi:hypothetical protein [Burkholderia sp. S171]|uniref:hypothetical protein n=1 Tax=Burkholderia sp. S171 TaxID=1641860 RepID=UPI00131BD26F|nr:hypothetical protein [Burkholderia sp. S171]